MVLGLMEVVDVEIAFPLAAHSGAPSEPVLGDCRHAF